jgi:hypothetical protein
MCNGVAFEQATGQTYCNVEWVNAGAILPQTRLARTRVLSIPGVDTLAALPHPAQGASPPGRFTGGRLVPRRANER